MVWVHRPWAANLWLTAYVSLLLCPSVSCFSLSLSAFAIKTKSEMPKRKMQVWLFIFLKKTNKQKTPYVCVFTTLIQSIDLWTSLWAMRAIIFRDKLQNHQKYLTISFIFISFSFVLIKCNYCYEKLNRQSLKEMFHFQKIHFCLGDFSQKRVIISSCCDLSLMKLISPIMYKLPF